MSSFPDPARRDAHKAQGNLADCAFALGRLDGALRSLRAQSEPLLAASLLARSLTAALRDAGYAEGETAFARWLPGGAPPQADPQVVLRTGTLVETVLRQLERSPWSALAASTALLRRAAPHLTASTPGHAAELELASAVIDQAEQITCVKRASSVEAGLLRFADIVNAAGASQAFALAQAGLATMQTPGGGRSYYHAAPRPHVWALGLVAGDALRHAGLLSRTVPMCGSILLGALRTDLPRAERTAFLFQGITLAAESILRLIETCHSHDAQTLSALEHFRSTSRAPAVFAFLTGVGPLTRAQIAAGFAVSRQGASGLIQSLVSVGLVRRDRGVVHPCSLADERTISDPVSSTLPPLSSLTEVDDALATIDALLAKTTRPEGASCS